MDPRGRRGTDRPRVLLIGAVDAPREPDGAFFLPYVVSRVESDPSGAFSDSADLRIVPYPRSSPTPVRRPFIGAGEASELPRAFADGASDYLRSPWTWAELAARAERLLAADALVFGSPPFELRGAILRGPAGSLRLNGLESALLRRLAERPGRRVSRTALHKAYWSDGAFSPRAVDMAVSRLRSRLASLAGGGDVPQIASVRGFGYVLD